jgi:hypothetical protein
MGNRLYDHYSSDDSKSSDELKPKRSSLTQHPPPVIDFYNRKEREVLPRRAQRKNLIPARYRQKKRPHPGLQKFVVFCSSLTSTGSLRQAHFDGLSASRQGSLRQGSLRRAHFDGLSASRQAHFDRLTSTGSVQVGRAHFGRAHFDGLTSTELTSTGSLRRAQCECSLLCGHWLNWGVGDWGRREMGNRLYDHYSSDDSKSSDELKPKRSSLTYTTSPTRHRFL